MKLIVKQTEPKEWTEYRKTPGAVYQSKKCLREALYREQGGICAYCMQRLKNEYAEKEGDLEISNRVEHIKCRDNYPELQLDYQNMVLCCNGKTNGSIVHCDRKKGNKEISLSPLNSDFTDIISYKSNGTICISMSSWQKEMDEILNLNAGILKANRAAALKGVKKRLISKKWEWSELKKEFTNWNSVDASGLYKPYCGIVLWYLNNKLNATNK